MDNFWNFEPTKFRVKIGYELRFYAEKHLPNESAKSKKKSKKSKNSKKNREKNVFFVFKFFFFFKYKNEFLSNFNASSLKISEIVHTFDLWDSRSLKTSVFLFLGTNLPGGLDIGDLKLNPVGNRQTEVFQLLESHN